MNKILSWIAIIVAVVALSAVYMGGDTQDLSSRGGNQWNYFTGGITNATVEVATTTTTEVLARNADRLYALIQNTDANNIWCALEDAAVADNGFLLLAAGAVGSTYEIDADNLFAGAVNCISLSATSTVSTVEK